MDLRPRRGPFVRESQPPRGADLRTQQRDELRLLSTFTETWISGWPSINEENELLSV